jgi:antitoxin HigA-1
MGRPAIHPGEHLAEELKALGMSAAELARQMQVPTNRVTEILNGQRALTGDTALRLGHFFGTSPEFWLNLQSLYELRLKNKRSVKPVVDRGQDAPRSRHERRSSRRRGTNSDSLSRVEWDNCDDSRC